jgi:toxin ParE1/3/4
MLGMPSDNFRVVWSPESEDDLLSIWRWGAFRFSPAIADAHLRDIHRAAMRLAFSPFMGRERKDLRAGIREIVVYPTVLFYRISGDRIEVVRVVDGRRDLAALFERE